jgi:hypothetical protein
MIVWIVMLLTLLGPATAAIGQPLDLGPPTKPDKAPHPTSPPDRDPQSLQPVMPVERPAYMRSLSDETRSRRMGAAAWTNTNPSVGSLGAANPESRGSAGFGFAVEWF